MNISTLFAYILTIPVCFTIPAIGQQLTAAETGNYAGINALHLNPSAIADSRWGGMVQLGTGAAQFSASPVGVETLLFNKYRFQTGGETWGMAAQDIRGPGVMVQVRPRHALAFTTRYRTEASLTNGQAVAGWFGGNAQPVLATGFGFTTNTFTEYGLTYATSVLDLDKHYLKAGFTVKLLRGIQTGQVAALGTFATNSTGLTYNLQSANYQYSEAAFTEKFALTDWLLGTSPGSGVGADLGFTYEFRPQHERYRYPLNGRQVPDVTKTKYRLRVGLALLDIGSIAYKAVQQQTVANKTGTLQQRDFRPLGNSSQYLTTLKQKLGFPDQTTTVPLDYVLPATFVAQLDGRLSESWFVGAVLKTSSLGQNMMVGPRYESPGADFSVTANYNSLVNKITAGMHLRFAIFTVGTNNLLGFFGKNGAPLNVFGGVVIPLAAKRAKDRDGDYVSDRKDVCPDVKGLWTFRGCPDTDEDGIKDQDDKCPNEAGPASTSGCPDADGDGIFDKSDACPTEAGPVKLNGCPDADGDGLADKEDECPREAGLPEFGGCPDTDRDGLKDSQDTCPTAAGLKELGGCPLQPLTRPDSTLTATDNAWLMQLTDAWKTGFTAQPTAFQEARAWSALNPGKTIMLEFSGKNQDELLPVATLFRDQLAGTLGSNSPFKLAVKVRAGQAAGLTISLAK